MKERRSNTTKVYREYSAPELVALLTGGGILPEYVELHRDGQVLFRLRSDTDYTLVWTELEF